MSPSSIRSQLETAIALARLLQQVEAGASKVDADAYRDLVSQLQTALSEELPERALQIILATYPAAGEVYENLHYGQAGLSRSPLERSVSSELLAKSVLTRVRSGAQPAA